MKPNAMRSTFVVKPSQCLERFVNDLKVTQPQLFDEMNLEIRKHITSQAETLRKRFPDPRARIVYRYLRAREERLMATLLENRLLEENDDERTK